MTNLYQLKEFRKDAEGFALIYEKEGKFGFILEDRVNGRYLSIKGSGYDTEEKALLSAFNSLEGKVNEQKRENDYSKSGRA